MFGPRDSSSYPSNNFKRAFRATIQQNFYKGVLYLYINYYQFGVITFFISITMFYGTEIIVQNISQFGLNGRIFCEILSVLQNIVMVA